MRRKMQRWLRMASRRWPKPHAKNAADAAMGRARFQTTHSSYAQAADAKEHAGYCTRRR